MQLKKEITRMCIIKEIESLNQVGNQSVNVSIASVSESSSGNTVKADKTQDTPV